MPPSPAPPLSLLTPASKPLPPSCRSYCCCKCCCDTESMELASLSSFSSLPALARRLPLSLLPSITLSSAATAGFLFPDAPKRPRHGYVLTFTTTYPSQLSCSLCPFQFAAQILERGMATLSRPFAHFFPFFVFPHHPPYARKPPLPRWSDGVGRMNHPISVLGTRGRYAVSPRAPCGLSGQVGAWIEMHQLHKKEASRGRDKCVVLLGRVEAANRRD